jgi:type II secretory pathway component PulF
MISNARLAEFCRRAATSLHAGLDARQVFERESGVGPAAQRRHMASIAREVNAGVSVADAMRAERGFFPKLALEMVDIGEQTGKLDRTFGQLSDHYENIRELRRVFFTGLIWPGIQLAAAVAIVGFLIWIMGLLATLSPGSEPIDLLGFGLVGTTGLLIYLTFVLVCGLALWGVIFAFNRGWLLPGVLMPILLRVPVLGQCLTYLAMSRMAWSLGMAIDAGMDAKPSLELALRGTQNPYYASAWPQIERKMQSRCAMSEALRATQRFPNEFLETLETGELTGMISETLERYAIELRDRARHLLTMLTAFAGFACWALVATIIIFLIFRLAMFYVGTIYDALDQLK